MVFHRIIQACVEPCLKVDEGGSQEPSRVAIAVILARSEDGLGKDGIRGL